MLTASEEYFAASAALRELDGFEIAGKRVRTGVVSKYLAVVPILWECPECGWHQQYVVTKESLALCGDPRMFVTFFNRHLEQCSL